MNPAHCPVGQRVRRCSTGPWLGVPHLRVPARSKSPDRSPPPGFSVGCLADTTGCRLHPGRETQGPGPGSALPAYGLTLAVTVSLPLLVSHQPGHVQGQGSDTHTAVSVCVFWGSFLLKPFTFFTQPTKPLPSDSCRSALCVCELVSILLVCSLDST